MLAPTPCDSRSAHFNRSGGPMPSLGGVVSARRPAESQMPLQRCFYSPLTWVKCPASLLCDGRFSGRVSAAASAVLLQSLRRGHRPPRVARCAAAASAVASQLPLQRCF
jgi:hypothetical protein